LKRTLVVLGIVAVCALSAQDAGAKVIVINASPRVVKTAPATPATEAVAQEKWVGTKAIVRDAKTGKLRRPTDVETRELVRSLRELTARSSEGPRRMISPNGQTQATVDVGVPQIIISRATEDGQQETLCVQTFDEAASFLGLKPAAKDE
jgi:hypothetical protein